MYSGIYGTEMQVQIFVGVVYYQRLRHMVSDKDQVRAKGPIQPIPSLLFSDLAVISPLAGARQGG